MLISGIHFDFFSTKETELQVRQLHKILSPKLVAFRRNRKKTKTKQKPKPKQNNNNNNNNKQTKQNKYKMLGTPTSHSWALKC